MNKLEQTITTLDIAEMMNMKHWQILRKLEGTEKTKGIIEILGNNNIVVTDYFIKSTYLTDQNKEMTCYKVTKIGCDFLSNKFQGEKGIVFTAKYVKRFHDMQQAIEQQQAEQLQQKPKKTFPLLAQNTWLKSKEKDFKWLQELTEWNRKTVYHNILLELGKKYDIDGYKTVYKYQTGQEADYIMEVVEYFEELRNDAEEILDQLIYNEMNSPFL